MARKTTTRRPASLRQAKASPGSAAGKNRGQETAPAPAPPPEPLLQFPGIVGQEAAVERLRGAMRLARLPHALLFCGPSGVGKRTTARALAAALLCHEARAGEGGCGRCRDCRLLEAGTHPDYHFIYKELAAYHDEQKVRDQVMQDLSIHVIRSFLIAPAGGRSARGRGKVFVVAGAELMSADAQNCLLKTLEEPPPGVTLVLLAERPEELLPTTVSRCQVVRFGPLPAAFVAERLARAGVEAGEARFWAAFAEGSVGTALRLAREEGLYAAKRALVEQVAALDRGGAGLGESLVKASEKLAESAIKQAKAAHGVEMSKLLAVRQGVAILLQLLASACRDALRLRCGPGARAGAAAPAPAAVPLVHADQPEAIAALARRFTPDQLAEVLEQLAEFERLLWRNVNAKTLWENAAITLASAAPLTV